MIKIQQMRTLDQVDQAQELLREEFPDHADTNIDFFYMDYMIAVDNNEVVGLITVQKYLPGKPILTDIVVKKGHRSKGIAIMLLHKMSKSLLKKGNTHLIGMTETKDRAALNTYRRCGGSQRETMVTTGDLVVTTARMGQILNNLELRKQK